MPDDPDEPLVPDACDLLPDDESWSEDNAVALFGFWMT